MGDDFVIDWTYQSVSINADMDVCATAAVVAERLGIELTEGVSHDGEVYFTGQDGGQRLSVSGEPTLVHVHATTVGHAIAEALSGPRFRLKDLSPHPEEWSQRSRAGWKRLLPELRAQGWQVDTGCPAAPVEVLGELPGGEEFYLRCRWDTCTLEVDDVEVGEVVLDGEFSASYLLPDDAVAVLLKLHQEWLTR
ncbi:hypothetical protein [Lentzea sp. CA-135723]|uniref:hypothetical protein n=1 Tax=Lentzea sp. CA-135723 TaxID=3239950 RepID=UPI003D9095EF